jgi:endonuclease I
LKKAFTTRLVLLLLLLTAPIFGQGAGNYYDAVSTSSPTFIQDLQSRIRSPYVKIDYGQYDETMVKYFASRDTANGQKVITCVYSGENYVYTPPFSWTRFSREHTWCHSWMPLYPDESGPEYSDQHHLFPTNQNSANGIRSNHPLGIVKSVSSSYLESKYGTDAKGMPIFEPRNSHKGDAARALLYMCLKYNGVRGDWTFNHLNSVTLPNTNEAPEDLNTLLEWNRQDPPDKWEVDRNNYIQSIQQNRNPFVDHPEYVNYINFNDLTLQNPTFATEPENYPTNITANAKDSSITLKWTKPSAGVQAASGYLILAFEKNNYFIPMDGVVYTDDYKVSDGRGVFNVAATAGDSLQICGLKTGTTYYFTVYSYNGTASQINYKTCATVPHLTASTSGSLPTRVYFTAEKITANEGDTYQLSVSIANPSPVNATTVDVALTSGSNLYVSGFRSQTITFPANSSTPQTVTLNLRDDSIINGTQTLVFQLQNATGGNAALVALPSAFTLSILDNDGASQGGGFENFAGFPETGSGYNSGSFKGKDGSTWNYKLCSGNSAVLITAPSPVLKKEAGLANVTSGILQGGCGTLNFKYMQSFSTNVKLGVYVNDKLITTVTSNGETSVKKESGPVTVNVSGTFVLKLQQIDENSGQVTIDDVQWTGYSLGGTDAVEDNNTMVPETIYLEQSYPNPCNPEAVIGYGLKESSHVSLKVYNSIGVEVASLVNGYQSAGTHTVKFNGTSLPSGIYFYRLEAGKYSFTKKLILLK